MGLQKKRAVKLFGHKTAVSVETEFWDNLKEIAANRQMAVSGLIEEIERDRISTNLSSSIRVFVLRYYQTATDPRRNRARPRHK
jgi:predicted DNA-binding ribbon-helix-helix protein